MKVSIVIPTYNRAVFLRELLESLVTQAYRPIEVLVMDDGSTDTTAVQVREFDAVPRDGVSFRYEFLEGRGGAQVARNRGVELATGDAFMFVDSDDVLAPDGLRQLAEALEAHSEWDYVYGRVERTDEKLEPLVPAESVGAPYNIRNAADLMGYHWQTMGALYRRECVERVGKWNEKLSGSQDWEYQARVKMRGGTGKFVDVLVGLWRQHAAGRVGTARFRADYARSVVKACESIVNHARKTGQANAELERRLGRRLFIHAWEFGANGYPEDRRDTLTRAARVLSGKPLAKMLINFYKMLPSIVDKLPLALIHRLQNRN